MRLAWTERAGRANRLYKMVWESTRNTDTTHGNGTGRKKVVRVLRTHMKAGAGKRDEK